MTCQANILKVVSANILKWLDGLLGEFERRYFKMARRSVRQIQKKIFKNHPMAYRAYSKEYPSKCLDGVFLSIIHIFKRMPKGIFQSCFIS